MSPINLDQADLDFAAELSRRPGGAGISKCYACGACSAVCPVMAFKEDYDPRRLIRLILLGQKETVLRNPLIWFCAACYSCQEVCPQQVDFTELSFALRNWAVDEGAEGRRRWSAKSAYCPNRADCTPLTNSRPRSGPSKACRPWRSSRPITINCWATCAPG